MDPRRRELSTRAGFFRGAGGARLRTREWRPAGAWRATVVIVHGLGEHGGRYSSIGARLAASGLRVAAFDLRGHGESSGQRGHVRRWEDYRADLGFFVDLLPARNDPAPYFLFGHSLGGLIALDFALTAPEAFRGLVLSAPALGATAVSPFLWGVAAMMDHVFPRFSVRVLKHTKASSPSAPPVADDDPLTHTRGTARLAMEVRATTARLRREAPNLALPLLLFHGTNDAIAAVEGSRWLFGQVRGEKNYREFPGAGHEVFNEESTREAAYAELEGWLFDRIGREPGVTPD